RQVADLLLLVRAAEVEPRAVRARVHLALAAEQDLLLAVGDLLPDGLVRVERVARLVDVGELHRLADAQRARVRLLLADDHAEQRRLAGAVRADHADDAAGRQAEAQLVDQQTVAVGLADVLRLDHDVAEPRSGRDRDLGRALALGLALGEELLVGRETCLTLCLTGARRHAHPLELALQRALARRLL